MTNRGGYESSSSIAQKLVAFVRESKRNILLQRITKVMAVFVVFVTTYMLILPAITLESAPSTTTNLSDVADVEWSYDSVTYDSGKFTLQYILNFSGLTYSEVTDGNGNPIYLKIDLGDIIPYNVETGYQYTAKDGSTDAFYYWFYQDANGDYYIVMQVIDSYLETLKNSTDGGSGNISFWSNSVEMDDDGKISFKTDTGAEIEIPAEDISHDENETWTSDITVTKTAAEYDASSNSITYTVNISSETGTDTITLTDLLSAYSGLSISSIKVDSVSYQQDTEGWGSYGSLQSVTEVTSSSDVSTNTGVNYYYTTDTSDDASSNLTIILSPLEGVDSDLTQTTAHTKGDQYIIKYTVTFDADSTEISTTIKNTATGTTYDKTINDDIESSSTTSKKATASVVDKSGSYKDDTITWTIDFNPYNANVVGYTLTDAKFAQAVADDTLTITRADGTTAVLDTDYAYVYDSETSEITGIKFLSVAEAGADASNTIHYTITYTETVTTSLGVAVYSTNTVYVTDDEDNDVTSDQETVNVSASDTGSLSKSFNSVYEDTSSKTVVMNWTTSLTVSEGSIIEGTTITDNLATYSNDSSLHTASEAGQWFTRTQIASLYASLSSASEDGSTGIVFKDGDTTYIIGTSVMYVVTDNGSTVTKYDYATQYPNADSNSPQYGYFYMQVYNSDTGWLDVSTVLDSQNESTYADMLFTAYRIVFNVDLDDVSGTTTISYATTASSDVATSKTFYNRVAVGGLSAEATHTEYNEVYKTDGKDVQDNSSTTTSDGTLTWKVKVYVPSGSTQDFIITDTLPSGVSFVSAYIESSYQNGTLYAADADANGETSVTLSQNGSTVTGVFGTDTSGNKTLAITVDSSAYSVLSSGTGGYIVITYTCKIDDFDATNYTGTNVTVGTYKNTVHVTCGGTDYGDDDQEQTVTYKEEQKQSDYLNKAATWNYNINTIDYEVTFNLEEATLANGENLTLTDVLKTNRQYEDSDDDDDDLDYLRWGVFASLDNSSVKFYQLYKLTESNGSYTYTDSSGVEQTYTGDVTTDTAIYSVTDTNGTTTYYLKEELDIEWVYTELIGDRSSWSTTTHTITATIPDATAILFTYTYDIEYINNYTDSTDMTTSISNSVSVSGSYTESEENSQKIDHNDFTSSGTMSTDSLTILKTDSSNTGKTLSGAEFALYKYSGTDWKYVETYTTNEDGEISISKNVLNKNTAYYLVETKAPDGYVLDSSTKYYFYASDSSVSDTCYPDGWFGSSYSAVTDISTATRIFYATNEKASSYTLTLMKYGVATVTANDGSETEVRSLLPGAVFTLYKWNGESWEKTNTTYTTDDDGQIKLSYADGNYTMAQAYKLVETKAPDGYAISSTVIYFCWKDSSGVYTQYYPSGWSASSGGSGTSVSDAIDLVSGDVSVSVDDEKIPTTSVTVTKKWEKKENGSATDVTDQMKDSDTVTVDLYYYLGEAVSSGGTEENTVNIYFGTANVYANSETDLSTNSSYISCQIPNNVDVSITITGNAGSLGWYDFYKYYWTTYSERQHISSGAWDSSATSFSFSLTADSNSLFYQVYSGSFTGITLSYTDSESITYTNTYSGTEWSGWVTAGGSSPQNPGSTGTSVSKSELTGESSEVTSYYYGTYTVSKNNGTWSLEIGDLPEYVLDSNGNKQYCYYYFVETGTDVSGYAVNSVTYSQADGIVSTDTDREITITNTIVEEEDSISVSVEKTWVKDGSSFDISEATVEIKLLQVLTATGEEPLYNQSSIDYIQTIVFSSSSIGQAEWTKLPATMEISGVTYTCSYYIVEASVVNSITGTGTSIADKYTVSYTVSGSEVTSSTFTYTDSGNSVTETYYPVADGKTITITNTAKDSIILPVTGGSGIRNIIIAFGTGLMMFAIAVILARQREKRRWSSA